MSIPNALALIAVNGTRQGDGKLLIDNELLEEFPSQITIEGMTFDLAEEEEIDAQSKACLGHYFRRD